MSIPHVAPDAVWLVRGLGSCEAPCVRLSRRALWFVLWAASACVGGPISDLPHSGDDETTGPPRTSDAGNNGANAMDASVPGIEDAGDASTDAGDAGLPRRLPDGGIAPGPSADSGDPCDDVDR